MELDSFSVDYAVYTYGGPITEYHFSQVRRQGTKRVCAAIEAYAPEVGDQRVLGILDYTIMGNGKKGFLVTRTHIYGSEFAGNPIEFPKLEAVKYSFGTLKLSYTDGKKEKRRVRNCGAQLAKLLSALVDMQKGLIPNGHIDILEREYEQMKRRQAEDARRRQKKNDAFVNEIVQEMDDLKRTMAFRKAEEETLDSMPDDDPFKQQILRQRAKDNEENS